MILTCQSVVQQQLSSTERLGLGQDQVIASLTVQLIIVAATARQKLPIISYCFDFRKNPHVTMRGGFVYADNIMIFDLPPDHMIHDGINGNRCMQIIMFPDPG